MAGNDARDKLWKMIKDIRFAMLQSVATATATCMRA